MEWNDDFHSTYVLALKFATVSIGNTRGGDGYVHYTYVVVDVDAHAASLLP